MVSVPKNASNARIAQEIGDYNPVLVLKFLDEKRPGHRHTLTSLAQIAELEQEAFLKGKANNRKRYSHNPHQVKVETLQASKIKNDCRQIFIEAMDQEFGGKDLTQPLRILTLPGTQFKTEEALLNHPRLGSKIGEILAVEGIPEVISQVEQKASEMQSSFPNTRITVIADQDTELTTTWRAELNPEAGLNAIWLDNMASWNTGNQDALTQLLKHPWMFERAWKEGSSALLFITLRAQQERENAKKILVDYQNSCPQVQAGSSLTHPTNQRHQWRLQGLTSFLFQEGKKNGLLCLPRTQYIYRHPQGKGSVMLLCGFEISPLNHTWDQPIRVEVERLQPQQ